MAKNTKPQLKIIVNINARQKLINSYSKGSNLQKFIDLSVVRKTKSYVPVDTTALSKSVYANTDFGMGQLIWTIYGKKEGRNTWNDNTSTFQGAPTRGSRWVERWANEGGRESLLEEIDRFMGR